MSLSGLSLARLPTPDQIATERARRALGEFVVQAWPIVEPGTPFVGGWHIDAICEHLEAVSRGEITRLLINVPPRHGKSLLVSVFWPAWAWARGPELRWLFSSYAQSLSTRDSVRCRRLLESPWYRERWGDIFDLTGDQNVKNRFENNRTGVRIATSVGGSATGEGGDILVCDDPHKIEEAPSDLVRERVIAWWDATMCTRLNDPARGAMVVIMQRVHERDLAGHLLEQGGWTHLCLPAEYDPSHPFCWPEDPRREPGELLCADRFGPDEVERLKRSLGSYGAAGQLQQRPSPVGGGIFQRSWWRYYDPEHPLPQLDEIVQSWDLSFGASVGSDYVVGQVWGTAGADVYLLRELRERMTFTQTLSAVREMTGWVDHRFPRHRGHAILVEQAANGAALVDVLAREIGSLIPIRPEGSKLSRAQAVSPQVEAGNVWLPGHPNVDNTGYDCDRTPPWVAGFIEELATFPVGAFDDRVDSMTMALRRLARPQPRLRVLTAPAPRRGLLDY
jgi:predicted phage terminase large subunit-like protein